MVRETCLLAATLGATGTNNSPRLRTHLNDGQGRAPVASASVIPASVLAD